jgi:MinD superfamily P-loop ATPase/predicted Fe-Mo cluster-binding NifX family protein
MKEIVVISGKGGTGKTSLTAAFAGLAENAVLADCDVDAADLHLILKPSIRETHEFSGGKLARIRTDKCIGCGECERVCRFDAVSLGGAGNEMVARTCAIDPVACEGCGVCVHFCPVEAIAFEDAINGQWFVSETRFGPMVHARLGTAEENSGKLVSLIRKQARQIAEANGHRPLLVVDGSPGIGCPVIASITGADLVVVVTEPTLSGRHDLDRVAQLTAHFGIPTAVCINKWDINPQIAEAIEADVRDKGLVLAGRIDYDPAVTHAQVAEQTIVEYTQGGAAKQVVAVWDKVLKILKETKGMKIAIPLADGKLTAHFGHCGQFAVVEVDRESKAIQSQVVLDPPPHEPGVLPAWLAGQGVSLVIAGGMGQRAQMLFNEKKIEVIVGAPVDTPETLVSNYLAGTLQTGANICDH